MLGRGKGPKLAHTHFNDNDVADNSVMGLMAHQPAQQPKQKWGRGEPIN